MFNTIGENEHFVVEHAPDKGVYRVSYFENNHYKDEVIFDVIDEVPHSGWNWDRTDFSLTCSNCRCRIWSTDISHGDANYCPNCGNKMDNIKEI